MAVLPTLRGCVCMYAGSGCPVQQTKWYRGVFHTRCAVYVKAFVFDGSSQTERTQEDGAFFTPFRPHAADICRMPRKERGKNNEYAGHRIDRSRVSVWRLYALLAAGWQTSGASTPLPRPRQLSMRTAGTTFPPTAGPCLHTSSAPLPVQALLPVRSRLLLSAGCRCCCGCCWAASSSVAVTDFGGSVCFR